MENWLAKHKNTTWAIYFIVIIILILVFFIVFIKNSNYVKYSPCEACIKMGYSCSSDRITDRKITPDQAWKDIVKDKELEEGRS